jgi:hypothetical protein
MYCIYACEAVNTTSQVINNTVGATQLTLLWEENNWRIFY